MPKYKKPKVQGPQPSDTEILEYAASDSCNHHPTTASFLPSLYFSPKAPTCRTITELELELKKPFSCIKPFSRMNPTGQNVNMTHNPTSTNQITKQGTKYTQMKRKSKHLRSNVPRIQIRSPLLNPESESNRIASELAMHRPIRFRQRETGWAFDSARGTHLAGDAAAEGELPAAASKPPSSPPVEAELSLGVARSWSACWR